MWDSFLQIVNLLVSPDWTSLVGLVPLGVGLVVVAYLGWQVRRAVTIPPSSVRRPPVPPPPTGTHAPSGSAAPIAAAIGAGCFVLGLLFVKVGPQLDAAKHPIAGTTTVTIQPFGGLALAFGLVVFVGSLLFWGRQGLRDYDALEAPARLPATTSAPPAGVHIPAPSFRPLLIALAFAVQLLGLAVRALPIAVAGVVMFIVAGLGWLADARVEYRAVERADATGHLESGPAPRFPTATLSVFAGLLVLAVLVTAGVIPPKSTAAGASPAPAAGVGTRATARASAAASAASASPVAPSASAAPGASGPSASAGPTASAGGGGAATRLQLVAQNTAYSTDSLSAPAGTPFQIEFTNSDAGIPHNVQITQGSPNGTPVFTGTVVVGVVTTTYDVPALPAGTYGFVCDVHPTIMFGTLTVK